MKDQMRAVDLQYSMCSRKLEERGISASQSEDGFQEEEGRNFSPDVRAALLIPSPGPCLSEAFQVPVRDPLGVARGVGRVVELIWVHTSQMTGEEPRPPQGRKAED